MEKETYVGSDGLEHCSFCNKPREKSLKGLSLIGAPSKVRCMCDCEMAAYEEEVKAFKKREFEALVSRNRSICFQNKRMYEWNFAGDDGRNPASAKIKAYVDSWDKMYSSGVGLLLWGGVGSGKTFLAAAVANALLDKGKKVLMRDFATISNISAFDSDEYVNSLDTYDLLILDDLGAERKSEFSMQNVFNVINRRWASGKPLIITTNLSINEMKALRTSENVQYQRIYDRIFDMCTPVCINGASRRKESAEKKKQKLLATIEGREDQ